MSNAYPPSDLQLLADRIVELVIERLGSGESANVRRCWAFTRKIGEFTGRKIDVVGSRYGRGEPATRKEDIFDAFVYVFIQERYTEQQDGEEINIPTEWVDERVSFVEQEIFNHLQAARIPLYTEQQSGEDVNYEWRCQSAEVVIVADPQRLLQHGLFSSELEFGFSRLKIGETE